MKIKYPILLFAGILALSSCSSPENTQPSPEIVEAKTKTIEDSVLFSFTFLGCNRVDRHQQFDKSATNESTANLSALKRIFNEISELNKKPELFFFLGDMVLAESTTQNLDNQLSAWVKLYNDASFSPISKSGIEMVAVPGNHEMLYYHKYPNQDQHDEWPLKGSTEIWMNHMHEFMPDDRDIIGGTDSLNNRMTFSFVRHNVGFVLMNTDTYNPPTKKNPYGLEGQIPTKWIVNKVMEYQQNPDIDHVFVLGHKPYYVSGQPETGHDGIPEGPILWPKLNEAEVVAMLSAHVHDYQRMQPGGKGTYQVIAGNSGSPGSATFFGYTMINILKDGKVELIAKGFDKGMPYYKAVPQNPSTTRDNTILSWEKNANPYKNN